LGSPVWRQPYPPHYRAAFASADLSFPLPPPLPSGRDTAAAGGMGLPQLTTEKLRAGAVEASDPVGVTDAAARWHLTRSYPLPFLGSACQPYFADLALRAVDGSSLTFNLPVLP